jgi:hypothetical protein
VPPNTPTGLTPGSTNQNNAPVTVGSGISLQWSPVAGATAYYLNLRNVTSGQNIHNPQVISSGSSYFNAQNLSPGLYYWEVCALNVAGCSNYTSPYYFQIQSATPAPVFAVTSLSQTTFDTRGQNYGSPSGNAYIPSIGIYGTLLDTAQSITWSWSGATSGSAVWTKSASGAWTNASGQARTVSIVSATQINASPALIAIGDTWTGTANWTVQVCNASGTCSSRNFTVLR